MSQDPMTFHYTNFCTSSNLWRHESLRPLTSLIVNLFDVQYHDKREHFLLSILLGILNSYISTFAKNDGYLETSSIFSIARI